MQDRILVTGGCGFIGSNFILQRLSAKSASVINLDKLTYAANRLNLASLRYEPRYTFVEGDINDRALVEELLRKYRPRAVVHFAAESHVDRSIRDPHAFVTTNVVGTYQLLEAVRKYWEKTRAASRTGFRFLHVSTDEVYGSLGPDDPAFTETTPYAPNSPYSASKAASDHFVRAYHHTYGLPTLITNCSNNYGPYQFPEKLIPLMTLNALRAASLPVYGDGQQVRDWLYVGDHCEAIRLVLERGRVGETYNIGGNCQKNNLEVVRVICATLDELRPRGKPHARLINHVKDRPGHDRRYAMDTGKIRRDLGWKPAEAFESGVRKTVQWYVSNLDWVDGVTTDQYRQWIKLQYANT